MRPFSRAPVPIRRGVVRAVWSFRVRASDEHGGVMDMYRMASQQAASAASAGGRAARGAHLTSAPTPSPLPEGKSATFTVRLDAMPCSAVILSLSSDDSYVTAPHHSRLSFAKVTGSGRWDRPQTVTVYSRQDRDAADETVTFTLRVRNESPAEYRALADVTVIVEVADDDTAALSVADTRVAEESGATLDFRVTLDRARHLPVTVDYATRDGTARAGQDYTATRGTLTFAAGEKSKTVAVPVLDDALDEGDETLVLRLSNASEAGIADGEATGTITNADPLQKMWLSRFGRTVAGHLTDAVSDRLAAPLTGAQVTVGGRRIDLAGRKDEAWLGETLTSLAQALGTEQETVPEGEGWPGSGLGVRESPAPVGSPAHTVPGREVLLGSAFHLARAGDGGGASLAAWGRVTAGGFDGAAPAETGDVSIDGDVTTGVLGADAEWDRLLAGVAVSVSEGEGTFDQPGVDSGTVESTMTTVSPYARMALTDRVSAWGLVGYGTGDMTIVQAANDRGQPERVTRSDLGMRLAAVGGRAALLEAGETGGTDLALKTDAFFVQTESEAVSNEGTTTADASRVRLILEGTRAFDLGDGAVLTPGLELGLRHDGGDAETGAGVELGGRVSFAAAGSGLSLEASVRTLVAHEVSGYEEWGASGAIRLAPGASGRGLSFRLAPTWDAPSSDAERLWSARDARALSPDGTFEPEGRRAPRGGARLWPSCGRRLHGHALCGARALGRSARLAHRLAARAGWGEVRLLAQPRGHTQRERQRRHGARARHPARAQGPVLTWDAGTDRRAGPGPRPASAPNRAMGSIRVRFLASSLSPISAPED